ncbi:unnamed protein product [Orchesella dallaii]
MYFSNFNQKPKSSSYEQYRKKEEDSAYDGSSESDGDDYPIVGKKKAKASSNCLNQMGYNFTTTPVAPNTSFAETASLDVFNNKATQFIEDRKSKKNEIWKDIAEEDLVTDIAASFYTHGGVRTDDNLQERGPEQYLNRCPRKRRFDERAYYPMFQSDSEISSDGLSDDSLEFVRSRRGKEMAKVTRNTVAGGRAYFVPQSTIKPKHYNHVNTSAALGSNQCSGSSEIISGPPPQMTEKSIPMDDCDMNGVIKENGSCDHQGAMDVETQKEEKKHLERKNRKAELEYRFKNFDDEKFVLKMVQHLQEQRNPDVILKAFRVLGREECLRLLHKTLKIKRCGGIVIKKKTRIRTTGGTFLYLIRNDKRILPDKKDAILLDDGEERPKEVTGRKFFDNPPKMPLDYNGLSQRIVSRSNRGVPQSRIDLEGDKFTLPSNVEVHETTKQTLPTRKEITYDDLDFEF